MTRPALPEPWTASMFTACAFAIVRAVGGSSTCANSKLGTPGGSGSYLADAIRSAHDFLNANGRSGATKAIVIFSDGGIQSS